MGEARRQVCIDSGSDAWRGMVAAGAIAGEGAAPVERLENLDVLRKVKKLWGPMDDYFMQAHGGLFLLSGAIDDLPEEEFPEHFGMTKQDFEDEIRRLAVLRFQNGPPPDGPVQRLFERKQTMRSQKMTFGLEKAPHRSLLYALGLTREEMKRPLIGVVNAANKVVPGHLHLGKIAEAVKAGIRMAGGTPMVVPGHRRVRRPGHES